MTFLLAPVFIRRSMPFGVYLVVFFALTLAIFATIFIWPIFPTTYTSSLGLTPFKIYSEYAVAIALFIAVLLLLRKRRALDKDVTRWIAFSISLTILSELFLTFPAHLTDLSNIIGHLLAILSAFLIYLAIVQTGLTHPFSLLFHDLKQSQLALKKERDFISAILDTAGALVVVMTPKGRIIRCNRACEELTGYSFAELRGRYAWNVGILPGEPDSIRAAFDEQQIDRLPPRFEGELTTRDKRRVRIEWSNAILLDPQNAVEFVITTGIDTTARYQAEDHLRYLSSHDTLTGLYNRALTGLYNRAYFETEMDRLAHSRKFPVSILMIDLDGLKAINDRHGHPAGDEVLRQAAEVLKASFRSEDVVARIGGDEFGVLLAEASAEVVDQAMLRVQENLLTYNTINRDLPVELSMGAATATSPALLPSSLSRADQAMYRAKKNKQRNQGQG
ncbi:MAG: diguanylate cyclase [Chloroflexi bacterium]|nr:diguanylate cyclase [Chloroflexota bacterium]